MDLDDINTFWNINAISAITFLVDCNFHGVGTLLMDFYYNYFHFNPGLTRILFDIYMLNSIIGVLSDYYHSTLAYHEVVPKLIYYTQLTFLLKWFYSLYFYILRHFLRKGLKLCAKCHIKEKQIFTNQNYKHDLDKFQDCLCVCEECAMDSYKCNTCKLVISTHFRYVPGP